MCFEQVFPFFHPESVSPDGIKGKLRDVERLKAKLRKIEINEWLCTRQDPFCDVCPKGIRPGTGRCLCHNDARQENVLCINEPLHKICDRFWWIVNSNETMGSFTFISRSSTSIFDLETHIITLKKTYKSKHVNFSLWKKWVVIF